MDKKTRSSDIIQAQEQRGVVKDMAGVRTKYSYSNTHELDKEIYRLEVPLAGLMEELSDLLASADFHGNVSGGVSVPLVNQSFCLLADKKDIATMLEMQQTEHLKQYTQDLFYRDKPYAVYGVRMLTGGLVISAYSAMTDTGVEINLTPFMPYSLGEYQLQIEYPKDLCDKADHAIVYLGRFKDDQANGAIRGSSYMRLEEFRRLENGKSQLIRRINSHYHHDYGYCIEVQKKEYL